MRSKYPKSMLNSPYCDLNSRASKLTPFMFGICIKPLQTTSTGWYFDGQVFFKKKHNG